MEQEKLEEEIETLNYQVLTQAQSDSTPCNVLLPNKLTCDRKAYVILSKIPHQVRTSITGNVICKSHFEIVKSVVEALKFNLKEITLNANSTNTNTKSES